MYSACRMHGGMAKFCCLAPSRFRFHAVIPSIRQPVRSAPFRSVYAIERPDQSTNPGLGLALIIGEGIELVMSCVS
jgi:hypothetical protein